MRERRVLEALVEPLQGSIVSVCVTDPGGPKVTMSWACSRSSARALTRVRDEADDQVLRDRLDRMKALALERQKVAPLVIVWRRMP